MKDVLIATFLGKNLKMALFIIFAFPAVIYTGGAAVLPPKPNEKRPGRTAPAFLPLERAFYFIGPAVFQAPPTGVWD